MFIGWKSIAGGQRFDGAGVFPFHCWCAGLARVLCQGLSGSGASLGALRCMSDRWLWPPATRLVFRGERRNSIGRVSGEFRCVLSESDPCGSFVVMTVGGAHLRVVCAGRVTDDHGGWCLCMGPPDVSWI
jgi:hypothetical protein